MPRGKFITLEGGEGAGKSTQAKKLAATLRKQGHKVVLTREVGGSPAAEDIRILWLSKDEGYWEPLTELLLIFAARRDHLVETIWPALKRGEWVICDRFMDSTRAYQTKAGPIEELYRQIAGDFEPDLTLLLDIPVETSMKRVKTRGGWDNRYDLKKAPFHKKLRVEFLKLSKKYKKRFAVIDAGRNANTVAKDIVSVVSKRFKV